MFQKLCLTVLLADAHRQRGYQGAPVPAGYIELTPTQPNWKEGELNPGLTDLTPELQCLQGEEE